MEYRTIDEWSFEQAQEEDDAFIGNVGDPKRPIFRFLAFRYLEDYEAEYKKTNNGFVILSAVRNCALAGVVMPDWLANAFVKRYHQVSTFKAGSWDEAFDKPFEKGSNVSAMRKAWANRSKIHVSIIGKIKSNPERPIDRMLFQEVADELDAGIGRTYVEDLYYDSVKKGWLDAKKVKQRLLSQPEQTGKSRK